MGRSPWRRCLLTLCECMLPCGAGCVQQEGTSTLTRREEGFTSAREHTAEYKPGIVSRRDKFRPNLLRNNSPIKHTQSVLIHP